MTKREKQLLELLESMQETNKAILIKAAEFERKYNKCIKTIRKFDAGIISMYDL